MLSVPLWTRGLKCSRGRSWKLDNSSSRVAAEEPRLSSTDILAWLQLRARMRSNKRSLAHFFFFFALIHTRYKYTSFWYCIFFLCSAFAGLIIANIIPIMMLGRKQSLKGEPVLADYGPEESLNENADIEWVNKVIITSRVSQFELYI